MRQVEESDSAPDASQSFLDKTATTSVGQSSSKPLVDQLDAISVSISFLACVIASAVVGSNEIAWRLGYNYQLVVVGFLLSIMAACLTNVMPAFLLRCEAWFGTSKLQNLDAIRTNSPLAPGLDWWWRSTLVLLLALPIGLSAWYKLFAGGQASAVLDSNSLLYNNRWGMFAPPGLAPLGWNTGILLMFNASVPFLEASTNTSSHTDAAYGDPINDLPLPDLARPVPYGFNMLLLNKTAAALLDLPPPNWIQLLQSKLGDNEAVDITANVAGTMSAYNSTVDQHREPNSSWWTYFADSNISNLNLSYSAEEYKLTVMDLYNGWKLFFGTNFPTSPDDNDESWCFLSLTGPNGESFYRNVKMFTTSRRNCYGTWRVTKGSVHLADGHCNDQLESDVLSSRSQLIFQRN